MEFHSAKKYGYWCQISLILSQVLQQKKGEKRIKERNTVTNDLTGGYHFVCCLITINTLCW